MTGDTAMPDHDPDSERAVDDALVSRRRAQPLSGRGGGDPFDVTMEEDPDVND